VFISETADGKTQVRETIDPQPAVGGGLWGVLLGTLVGGATSAALGALIAKLLDVNALAPTDRQTVA